MKMILAIIMVSLLILSISNIPCENEERNVSNEKFYWHMENQVVPQCNMKWFFQCKINSSGFANQTNTILHEKIIRLLYFDSSQGYYGTVHITSILGNFDSDHVYSASLFGFKG